MPANIFIARHGQNQDNAKGIINGRRDLPLTDLGRQQSGHLAEGIIELGLEFQAIYTSPLVRASETAEIVSSQLNTPGKPKILPDLIEREFGIMTGKHVNEITELCPPEELLFTSTITYFLKPEGAETFPQVLDRAQRVLGYIRSQEQDGNVLLVCHGDMGKMIYAAATGKPWRDVLINFHFGNAELLEISAHDNAHLIKLPQHNL